MNTACDTSPEPNSATESRSAAVVALDKKIARFAPVNIGANVDALPANEQIGRAHV